MSASEYSKLTVDVVRRLALILQVLFMGIYRFTLPTTGAISFADFLSDPSGKNLYASQIAQTTQARANLRGALKENKRADEKDFLRLIKVRYSIIE